MSIESNYKLTQEQFNQLIDQNTSRKTFKDLSSLVTCRFDYIINKIYSVFLLFPFFRFLQAKHTYIKMPSDIQFSILLLI